MFGVVVGTRQRGRSRQFVINAQARHRNLAISEDGNAGCAVHFTLCIGPFECERIHHVLGTTTDQVHVGAIGFFQLGIGQRDTRFAVCEDTRQGGVRVGRIVTRLFAETIHRGTNEAGHNRCHVLDGIVLTQFGTAAVRAIAAKQRARIQGAVNHVRVGACMRQTNWVSQTNGVHTQHVLATQVNRAKTARQTNRRFAIEE